MRLREIETPFAVSGATVFRTRRRFEKALMLSPPLESGSWRGASFLSVCAMMNLPSET